MYIFIYDTIFLPKLNSPRNFDEIKKKNKHVLETCVVCSMKIRHQNYKT